MAGICTKNVKSAYCKKCFLTQTSWNAFIWYKFADRLIERAENRDVNPRAAYYAAQTDLGREMVWRHLKDDWNSTSFGYVLCDQFLTCKFSSEARTKVQVPVVKY